MTWEICHIHTNIEINENVELEYEIKLPQFLIDYSEKTNKKESKSVMQLLSIKAESEEATEIIEEYDEEDLLMEEERSKDKEIRNSLNKGIWIWVISWNLYNIRESAIFIDSLLSIKWSYLTTYFSSSRYDLYIYT